MRKRIFSFIFVLVLMMSLLPGVPVRADSADGFVGSRTVSFEMDSSDVENFYDGGMTALSLKLRMHAPLPLSGITRAKWMFWWARWPASCISRRMGWCLWRIFPQWIC